MYKNCPFYSIKSKKMLFTILKISDKKWQKKEYVQQKICPYIDGVVKQRLVEVPSPDLKIIQKRIKNALAKCDFPTYVYSGVKGKSYIDNAKVHKGKNYLYKIDISAFFPNTPRESVYKFFYNDLKTSPDVANILTNFCTADLSGNIPNKEDVISFINKKGIIHLNHLCTGASPSPLLSYLVNRRMFDKMVNLCEKHNVNITIYVDDVIFTSPKPIAKYFRNQILAIVKSHGYNVSKKKVKYYTPNQNKKVTGVIIRDNGNLDVPNKLRLKIKSRFESCNEPNELLKLQGCVVAARQINNQSYPSITEYIKQKRRSIQNKTT